MYFKKAFIFYNSEYDYTIFIEPSMNIVIHQKQGYTILKNDWKGGAVYSNDNANIASRLIY